MGNKAIKRLSNGTIKLTWFNHKSASFLKIQRFFKVGALLCFSVFLLSVTPKPGSSEALTIQTLSNPKLFIHDLITEFDSIKGGWFTVKNKERIGGEYLSGKQRVWYEKQPYRCVIQFIEPNKGSKLTFKPEVNKSAIYSPKGFPYFDMELDPFGRLMRRNNHHTVYDVGFKYINSIIKAAIQNKDIEFIVTETTSGYTIKAINHKFGTVPYTVKKGENITDIAQKRGLNEYLILEKNPSVGFYTNVKEGDKILITNSYAKEVQIFLDKTKTLSKIIVMDEKGLFEEYNYSEITITKK